MATKHTPGPWWAEVSPMEFGGLFGSISNADGCVAFVTLNPEQVEANTHLIAAAPELLEALKGLVAKSTDAEGDWSAEWLAALNAIAKAEGRS